MKLSDREWGIFTVGSLFSVKRPSARNKDSYELGEIPFVASGSENNGVMKCCKPHDDEKLDSCCITVSPVDGSSFYQPYSFLGRGGAGSSILLLYSEHINLYSGQFIARMIFNTCSCKYTYGHMGNKESIKRERIMLPIDDMGEPDYQFMENYIKELMVAKRRQYKKYVVQRLAKLGIDDLKNIKVGGYNLDLESRDYKPFPLGKLFIMERGKAKKDFVCEGGCYPFVSAKNSNNGVRMFVEKPKNIFPRNTISLNSNGDGGTGFGYYQSYDYTIDVNTTALIPKSDKIANQFSELFITGCFGWLHNHFGNALPLSLKRAKKACIMLPVNVVNGNDEPDYEFIEECGRNMMAKKYIQYLKFLESTGNVVEI